MDQLNAEQLSSLYHLNQKGNNFPMCFSFSELINTKLQDIEAVPTVFVALVQSSSILSEQVLWANKELSEEKNSIQSILRILKNIHNDNKVSTIYKDYYLYSFNNNLHYHGTSTALDNTTSTQNLEKSILENSKQSNGNLVNAFSQLLLSLDNSYASFFTKNSKAAHRRISKYIIPYNPSIKTSGRKKKYLLEYSCSVQA
jgi:hypothetical protein